MMCPLLSAPVHSCVFVSRTLPPGVNDTPLACVELASHAMYQAGSDTEETEYHGFFAIRSTCQNWWLYLCMPLQD